MATEPRVRAKLEADTTGYERSLKSAAKATDRVADAQDDVRNSAQRSKVAWAALGTAVTVAGYKMLGVMRQSVAAASDLNESASKAGVVFGQAADKIDEFAESSSTALGMSKRSAYDAASMMALFGKSAGLAGDELVTFSTDMVQLASDMASFFNTSPEDAIQAIGSALRGETESIRRYNVLIDAATLQQRAFAMGLTNTTKQALTPQQRVLAAQAEILAQTTDAQGDFARTSDGVANSQRIMTASIENAKAALGEALLPIVAKGAQAVAMLAEAFTKLPKPLQAVLAGLGGTVAALALIAPAAAVVVNSLGSLVGAYKTHRAAALASAAANDAFAASMARAAGGGLVAKIQSVIGWAAKLAGALAAVTGAYALFRVVENDLNAAEDRRVSEHVKELADDYRAAIVAGRELNEVLKYTVLGADIEVGDSGIRHLLDQIRKFGPEAESVKDSFAALDEALTSVNVGDAAAAYERLTYHVLGAGYSVEDLSALLPRYTSWMSEGANGAQDLAAAEQESADAIDEQRRAAELAAEKIESLTAAMWGYINAALAEQATSDDLKGAHLRLAEAVEANGTALTARTAAGRANRAALRDEISAVVAHSQAVYENAIAQGDNLPTAVKKAQAALREGRAGLKEAAGAFGENSGAAQKMIDKYTKIPKDIRTEIKAEFNNLEQNVEDKVIDPLNRINPAVQAAMAEAARSGSAGGEAVVEAIRNGASGAPAVGANIAAGVASGISGATWLVDEPARLLAQRAIHTANAALGIESPSKVFHEIGRQIVAGLVKGLDDNKHRVRDALNGVIDKVNAALSDMRRRIADLRTQSASLGSSIARSLGTFGEGLRDYQKTMATSPLSPAGMVANMRGSVSALKAWQADLTEITKRGAPRELVEELREMGLDSADELAAITRMNGYQFSEFVRLWKERNKLAAKEGAKQYADDVADAMGDLKKQLKRIGANAMDGLADGLEGRGDKVKKRLRKLLREILGDAWADIAASGGNAGYVMKRAGGGPVRGPGSGTSDQIPAWLSNGEYVMRAAAVDKYGQAFFDLLNYGTRAPRVAGGDGFAAPSGAMPPIVVNLILDGRTVQRSLIDVQRRTGVPLFPVG